MSFGIFLPKDSVASSPAGSESRVSKNQTSANSPAFAEFFSQSLRKQTQSDTIYKASSNVASQRQSNAGSSRSQAAQPIRQKSSLAKSVSHKQNTAHTDKPAANRGHASASSGKRLPQNRHAESTNTESASADAKKAEPTNTESANNIDDRAENRDSPKAAKYDDDKRRAHDVGDSINGDASTQDGSLANVNASDSIDISSQTAALDLPTGDIASQPVVTETNDLQQSDFAAFTPTAQAGNNTTGDGATAAASSVTPSEPTVSQTPPAQLSSAAKTTATNQLQTPNSVANDTAAADDSALDLSTATPTVDSVESEPSAKSSSLGQSNDALLRAAEDGTPKPTQAGADKAIRSLNDAIQLASNSFNKNASSQTVADAMAGANTGQHTGNNHGDNPQSTNQDSALLRDRFFTLAQQASATQSPSPHSNFNKLILQQVATVEPAGTDQRVNDVNLNPVREPALVNRVPGNPLQLLSPVFQMSSAFGQNGWSGEVGQKVMWMVHTDLQQAQLQLNPKHLGPLEIKITMNADQQINVSFLTHSTAVKDALDQAMPRLREAFDQSGLNLSDVNVQQDSSKQNRDPQHSSEQSSLSPSYLAENVHDEATAVQMNHNPTLSSAIVDFYA